MVGIVEILGCMPIACGVITAAAAIVGMGVGIDSALKSEERQERIDAQTKENTKQQQILQRRQQAKAIERAAQLAARGMLLDSIQTTRELREAKDVRRRSRVRGSDPSVPRPSRNFGTPINENGVIRLK